jgi:NitT/TauT family transport system substrate-binding protein
MLLRRLLSACALAFTLTSAQAQDVRVAVGSGGNLEAFVVEIGAKAGIFQKNGINPSVFYTSGGGETLQALISQSAQVGVAIGATGAFGAFSKGAPLRLIGSSVVGSPNYWYVPANSPIKTMKDIAGRKLAYSTAGSGTYAVAQLVRRSGVDAQLVATGNTPGTFTQVMTGQVDVGFAYPEFKQEALASGEIRILFRDNDFDHIRNQSLRVIAVHHSMQGDFSERFMRAYAQSVDWILSGDQKPMEHYAELLKTDLATAIKLRDQFWNRQILAVEKVRGSDLIMQDAVEGKFLTKPLTKEELDQLIAPHARP